jgi:hypothetical protein
MTAPNDVYQEMAQSLLELEEACLSILKDLGEFENYAGSYSKNIILQKLSILAARMVDITKSLYEEHKGSGYVCAFLREQEGITVLWVEDREIVEDKSWYATCGSTVLSPEEVIDIICGLTEQLKANNWVEVVEWLNTYGKYPGLDFSRLT